MYDALVQSFQSIVKESLKLKNRWSGHLMDRHPIFDIIANDSTSSSDNEVEMIIRFAIEEERLNSGGGSRPCRRARSLGVILCKPPEGFSVTILLNHHYIL